MDDDLEINFVTGVGKIEATVVNNPEASLAESSLNVMLELTGAWSGKDRPGIDLVIVLDVCQDLPKEKLHKVKIALEFVINKLSILDRLCIICGTAWRLCFLRQITKAYKPKLKSSIDGLDMWLLESNTPSGLEMALTVLNDRRFNSDRPSAILLVSQGGHNLTQAPEELDISNVPIFTFGFGSDHDPLALSAIALKSKGGTFSSVQNPDDLTLAFAQCLGGLFAMAVEELEVAFESTNNSKIVKVSTGNYEHLLGESCAIVSLGNLYIKEVRRVVVELLLPPVRKTRSNPDILEISYRYKSAGTVDLFEAPPIIVRVRRSGDARVVGDGVFGQSHATKSAQMMRQARILADQKNLSKAMKKLAKAQNVLEDIVTDEPNPMIDMMKYELGELLDTMQSEEVYAKQGRSFALSSETSHEHQRYAMRGDVSYLRIFSTPVMERYLGQAKAFVKDPRKPVPIAEEDVMQKLGVDGLSAIA